MKRVYGFDISFEKTSICCEKVVVATRTVKFMEFPAEF